MRRRDIIMASPYGAEIATRDVFGPVVDALTMPIASMADVRRLKSITDAVHEVLDAHQADTPDKAWRQARRREKQSYISAHQWKCRALQLNPQTTPTLALGSMTPMNVDGWKLAVAIPAPSPVSFDADEITTIVLIDPKTGEASIFEDKHPQLVLPIQTGKFTVHADARTWAREIAQHRLEFVRSSRIAARQANIPPVWHGAPPSALAVGKISKIEWPMFEELTIGEGIDPKAVHRAVRRPRQRVHAPIKFRSAA